MRSLEQLDSWITAKMRGWSSRVSGGPRSPEILEIRREILHDIGRHIEPKGAGKNVFPYNSIVINLAAENPERANLLERAIGEDGELDQTVSGLLSEAGCPARGIQVTVQVSEDALLAASDRPFRIEYLSLKGQQVRGIAKARPKISLVVVRGQADSPQYTFEADRVNIGRLREVVSDKEGLRRRNDVAFAETETTVSREHAYIRYDHEGGKFRLYDSLSQRGTSVFREGRRYEVPKGPVRGFQLSPGDEIHLGDTRLRFETSE